MMQAPFTTTFIVCGVYRELAEASLPEPFGNPVSAL